MTRTSRVAAALVTLLLGLALAIGAAAPAASAAEDDGSVTWSVSPASAEGPDGRVRIETTLDPGESIVEHLAVKNLSATAVTFAIKAADGYRTETGRFNMLPSDQPSVDAGLWISAPETVLVESGATAIVEFTITVPENVTPGDHAAGIAATIQSIGTGDGGNQVSVESRVGFPIMLRITGELEPAMHVEAVSVQFQFSWNPFQPGWITAVYDIVNDGNVRTQALPVVESQGRTSDPGDDPLGLLPGDRRQVTTVVPGVWPLFYAPVEVRLDPTVVSLDGEPEPSEQVTLETGVWALPLPQVLVILGVLLVILAFVAGRKRSNARLEAKLEEAREAGRREAER